VGKPLKWDPLMERFTGAHASEGNALVARGVRRHR
jgi:hypothetical protein